MWQHMMNFHAHIIQLLYLMSFSWPRETIQYNMLFTFSLLYYCYSDLYYIDYTFHWICVVIFIVHGKIAAWFSLITLNEGQAVTIYIRGFHFFDFFPDQAAHQSTGRALLLHLLTNSHDSGNNGFKAIWCQLM